MQTKKAPEGAKNDINGMINYLVHDYNIGVFLFYPDFYQNKTK